MAARTMVYKRSEVPIKMLYDSARGLMSENHENAEYDRALVELVCECAGMSMDYVEEVAGHLGVEYLYDGSRVPMPFESIASEFESGWADAHSDHRDANLWQSSPFYRGGYLAGATRPFPVEGENRVTEATREALAVDGVKSAFFRLTYAGVVGTVWDNYTSMEYDVRKDENGWNVNDDNGDDYQASTLGGAITFARGVK